MVSIVSAQRRRFQVLVSFVWYVIRHVTLYSHDRYEKDVQACALLSENVIEALFQARFIGGVYKLYVVRGSS